MPSPCESCPPPGSTFWGTLRTQLMATPPFFTLLEQRPDGALCLSLHGDLGYDTTAFARCRPLLGN